MQKNFHTFSITKWHDRSTNPNTDGGQYVMHGISLILIMAHFHPINHPQWTNHRLLKPGPTNMLQYHMWCWAQKLWLDRFQTWNLGIEGGLLKSRLPLFCKCLSIEMWTRCILCLLSPRCRACWGLISTDCTYIVLHASSSPSTLCKNAPSPVKGRLENLWQFIKFSDWREETSITKTNFKT